LGCVVHPSSLAMGANRRTRYGYRETCPFVRRCVRATEHALVTQPLAGLIRQPGENQGGRRP
jgi:hypothetical protein